MNDIEWIGAQFESVWKTIVSHRDRLTALESRKCNCSAASSAGYAIPQAVPSAGSGGTAGSESSGSTVGGRKTSATSASAATVAADPVSAAIRDDSKPAPVAKAEHVGETAWLWWSPVMPVAAAKAKPHAETAEEVADRILDDYYQPVDGARVGHRSLRQIIISAIKRERGEA